MKDPLQHQETPYEVLGVAEDASADDVERAFKSKLAARGNPQKLTAARRVLSQPVERALVDLFCYASNVQTLRPNPLIDASVLSAESRAATAATWFEGMCSTYPCPPVAHALAVCHYWSALAECDDVSLSARPHAIESIESHWRLAIGAWASLVDDATFWSQWPRIPEEHRESVAAQIRQRLANDIDRIARRFQETGVPILASRIERLSTCCEDEFETAKVMAAARLGSQRGMIVGGRLFFEALGLREDILSAVHVARQRSPEDRNLRFLQQALSRHGAIWFLLRRNQFQEAVKALDEVREADLRRSTEFCSLECQALLGVGIQLSDLRRWDDAISSFERALTKAGDAELKQSIADRIAHAVSAAIAERRATGSDEGIFSLLERAVSLLDSVGVVPGENLRAQYADRLCDRGIRTINTAQEELGNRKADLRSTVRSVERGRDDLRRAAELGSSRAAEQLPLVQQILATLTVGSSSQQSRPAPSTAPVRAQPSPFVSRLIREWSKLSGWVQFAVFVTAYLLVALFIVNELDLNAKDEYGNQASPILANLFTLAICFIAVGGAVVQSLARLTVAIFLLFAIGHWVFKDRSEPSPPVAHQVDASRSVESKPPTPPATVAMKPDHPPNKAAKEQGPTPAIGKGVKQSPVVAKPSCPNPSKLVSANSSEERTQALRDLQTIERAGPDCRGEATLAAAGLATKIEAQPEITRSWAMLVVAVTFEAVSDTKSAVSYYERLRNDPRRELSVTAGLRLAELDPPAQSGSQAYYLELLGGGEGQAWIKRNGNWEYATVQTAANHALLAARVAEYPIRFFEMLRDIESPLAGRHRYLGSMLGLVVVLVLVQLPTIVARVRMGRKVAALAGTVAQIRQLYAHDATETTRQVASLYKQHGINPAAGCLWALVEIGLWCGALYAFTRWTPRLALDMAGFFWIDDVLAPDTGIVLAWCAVAMLMAGMSVQGTSGQKLAAAIVMPSVITGVALYFGWPAYVMVGWTMLLLLIMVTRAIVAKWGRQ